MKFQKGMDQQEDLKRVIWESSPAIESDAPTKNDERTLGSLIFKRMFIAIFRIN